MILLLMLPFLWCLGGAGGALVVVALRSRRFLPAAVTIGGLALVDLLLWIGEPWW